MRPYLLLLVMLSAVHLGLAQDELNDGSIVTDLAQAQPMKDEEIFRIGQGGMGPEVVGTAPMDPETIQANTTSTATTSGLSGRWHLSLEGIGDIDLALHRVGEVIFGTGELPQGNVSEELTASGNLEERSLSMNILALNGSSLLQLRLDVGHGTLNGTYQGFDSNGSEWEGLATGTFPTQI